jgi:hypothetical protein
MEDTDTDSTAEELLTETEDQVRLQISDEQFVKLPYENAKSAWSSGTLDSGSSTSSCRNESENECEDECENECEDECEDESEDESESCDNEKAPMDLMNRVHAVCV